DVAGLEQAMELAGERAGASDIRLSSQRNLVTRRMLNEMGLQELDRLIAAAQARGDTALAERLTRGREALFDEAGRYVARQHDLYASESGRRMREELLAEEKLNV